MLFFIITPGLPLLLRHLINLFFNCDVFQHYHLIQGFRQKWTSDVTGSKPSQVRFQDFFGHINWFKLRKCQYTYDNNFSGLQKTCNDAFQSNYDFF